MPSRKRKNNKIIPIFLGNTCSIVSSKHCGITNCVDCNRDYGKVTVGCNLKQETMLITYYAHRVGPTGGGFTAPKPIMVKAARGCIHSQRKISALTDEKKSA